MRNPLRLRRPVPQQQAAHVVSLVPSSDGQDDVMTAIPYPDSLSPLDHPGIGLSPVQADCRLAINQTVSELAGRGALDEGSAAVLDYAIDGQSAVWRHQVIQEAERRRVVAARLVAADTGNLQREARLAARLEAELAEASEACQRYRCELLGIPEDLVLNHGHTPSSPGFPSSEVPSSQVGQLLAAAGGTVPNAIVVSEPKEL